MEQKHNVEEQASVVVEAEKANVVVEERRRDYFLPVSILIAGLMVSGSIIYLVGMRSAPAGTGGQQAAAGGTQAGAAPTVTPTIGDRDVVLGNVNAPVTLIEYADYQCPFCGQFYSNVEPQLRANYITTGKVKMVYKNFQFLGPESVAAGEAAECAKDQSKFWEYHDALYGAKVKDAANGENDGFFTRDEFLKLAANVGLDINAFTTCIDGNTYASKLSKDLSDAQAVGVNSTPTSFVDGVKVTDASGNSVGANGTAIFAAIDAALAKK